MDNHYRNCNCLIQSMLEEDQAVAIPIMIVHVVPHFAPSMVTAKTTALKLVLKYVLCPLLAKAAPETRNLLVGHQELMTLIVPAMDYAVLMDVQILATMRMPHKAQDFLKTMSFHLPKMRMNLHFYAKQMGST